MTKDLTGLVCCVPIRCDAQWPGVSVRLVEEELHALGNPMAGDHGGVRPSPESASDDSARGSDHEVHRTIGEAIDKTERIHFMSLAVIWNGEAHDRPFLLLDITGDGDWEDIIAALVAAAGKFLLPAFGAAYGVETHAALELCLLRYARRAGPLLAALLPGRTTGLAFQGTPGLSVKRIRGDQRIEEVARQAIADETAAAWQRERDRVAKLSGAEQCAEAQRPTSKDWRPSAKLYWVAARRAVMKAGLSLAPEPTGKPQPPPPSDVPGAVWAMLSVSWFAKIWGLLTLALAVALFVWADIKDKVRLPAPKFGQELRYLGDELLPLIATILTSYAVALLTVGVLLATIAVGLSFWLRTSEEADKAEDLDPDVRTVRQIMQRENRFAQNHMIGVSTIKPALLRGGLALPAALYVVALAVRARLFKSGFLADVGTIHCAQWIVLPGTNKLLFFSNYDGSWQSYLEDFITKANTGLTAIWSNTVNFPKSAWLFLNGASDGERFKRWARRQQIPTPCWYSGYPRLTAQQIRTNALIRACLSHEDATDTQSAEWLAYFGSSPRPDFVIETPQVQGLVLNSHRNLLEGVCLVVEFPSRMKPEKCRDWLREVKGEVSFDEGRKQHEALFLGLTAHGLHQLGLTGLFDPMPPGTGPIFSNFPSAFVLGMASHTRSRVLGDVGENAQEKWKWGRRESAVHAVLLIYAKTCDELDRAEAKQAHRLKAHGLRRAARIRLKTLPPVGHVVHEPFGFVDGISQPAIRGVRPAQAALADDIVEPGEFILGYPDGRKQFPPTPQIYASYDHDLLSNLPEDFPASPGRPADVRDLGQNGSFLVIRQLEQDIGGFETFLAKEADKLSFVRPGAGASPQDWLAAKLVGRWKNGAPLVAYPDEPPKSYDINEEKLFRFGLDDPQGLACPLGAHIRRANPRDTFDPEDPDQIGLTNRHRLLRRGRVYVDGDNANQERGTGLLFMCLNADIERQFEFVQQTWIGSRSFNGLEDESDPIVRASGGFTIPLHKGPEHVPSLHSFVKMVGGGYFFLPSKRALNFLSELKDTAPTLAAAEPTAVDPALADTPRAPAAAKLAVVEPAMAKEASAGSQLAQGRARRPRPAGPPVRARVRRPS